MTQTYKILEEVIKYFPNHSNVYVTSTTGGGHSKTSYHYRGQAIDVGSASQTYKDQLAAWLYKYSGHITELLHSKAEDQAGWYVKNEKRVGHAYYGKTLTLAHVNHVHLAVNNVADANALLAAVKKDAAPAKPIPMPPFPGTMKLGSNGPGVKTLQLRLNARGYQKLTPDGDFGKSTEDRVKDFQKFAKIAYDGIVGPTTWAKLYSLKVS